MENEIKERESRDIYHDEPINVANKQSNTTKLSVWLVYILWLKVALTSLSIVYSITNMFRADIDPREAFNLLLAVIAVIGAYRLIKADKVGFYLIVAVNLLLSFMSFFQYIHLTPDDYGYTFDILQNQVLMSLWGSFGQIVFLMLLMLIKKNGINAYQVLWANKCTKEGIKL